MNKKALTEADIRTKFITPNIVSSGWDVMTQIREEAYFTKGRVIVRGKTVKRGDAKRADYIEIVWQRSIRNITGFTSSYTVGDAVDWLGPNP